MHFFIDTHTHLYSKDFTTDIDIVIQNAIKENITKFYLPAIDSGTHTAMLSLEEKYPQHCVAMMGLHPCSVKEDYATELKIIEDWLAKRKFAAIGEIGFDFYWDKTFTQEQHKAFHAQAELALHYQLPIVIHTRNAMSTTIDAVKKYAGKNLKGIFHCFGGSYEEAMAIIEQGFLLGIGGVLTYKNSGLTQVLEKIDLKHLVLETDAPYLTPVPHRGKRNESSYIKYVVEKLAAIKNCSATEIAAVTTANAKELFAL
jgi:TatD DNase family protein